MEAILIDWNNKDKGEEQNTFMTDDERNRRQGNSPQQLNHNGQHSPMQGNPYQGHPPMQGRPHQGQPPMQGNPYQGQPPMQGQNQHVMSEKPSKSIEKALVTVWIPRVFILVLILGVLFGFMAAVNAGIFSESVRCWIGAIFAAVMYGFGVNQMNKHREQLGKVLLGGAHCILVLSISAAHLMYQLIPIYIATLLYIVAIGIMIFTSTHWKSQTLFILSIVSGYLLPFLIDYNDQNNYIALIYLALFSAVFILFSSRYHYYIAYWFAYGALHIALFVTCNPDNETSVVVASIAVILQHIVLFIDYMLKKDAEIMKASLQFVSFVVMEFWLILMPLHESPVLNRVVLACAIIGYIIAYWWSWKKIDKDAEQLVVKTSARMITSMVIVSLAIIILIQDIAQFSIGVTLVFIEAVCFIILGLRLRSTVQWLVGSIIGVITGLMIPIQIPEKILSFETLGWVVLLIAIPLVYRSIIHYNHSVKSSSEAKLLLWLEAFLGLMFVSIISNLVTKNASSEYQYLAMSLTWLLYAIGAIVIGVVYKFTKARITGIIFLFVVLLKVIIVDVPDVSLAVKAILFIVLGVAGLLVSRMLYGKKEETEENASTPQQSSQQNPSEDYTSNQK